MADLTLTEFVPGTKAKAEEVNANFSTLKDAVNAKAALAGDSTQIFAVADATADSHAVNKSQLTDLSENLTAQVNKMGTKFCVKSGHTTGGKGDLFNYNVLEITPKIAGTYGNLVFADYHGTQTTISTAPGNIDLTGNSDGEYNIFIKTSGELYILKNKIYKQASRPTMTVNDIWFNTSAEPFTCIKYSGTSDLEFLDVPLGKVTVKNSAITAIETFPFNQNGHNVNAQTTLESGTDLAISASTLAMPDYENGISKSFATVHQAEFSGFLYIKAPFGSTFYVCSGNPDTDSTRSWTSMMVSGFGDQGYLASIMLPIAKGFYYKVTVTYTATNSSLTFYPCLAI